MLTKYLGDRRLASVRQGLFFIDTPLFFFLFLMPVFLSLTPQINLQRRMRVTGLITQGAKRIGSPEYIKSYKVAYSDDGKTWRTYKVKGKAEDMVRRAHARTRTHKH